MEDIIVKHLRLSIDTDVECYKNNKNNLNTCLYSKICRIVEEELKKKIDSLYSSLTESGLPKSSINIVIKEIKINLDCIPLGEYFLETFSHQLAAKLSEEFNNNIKKEFKEQHNINSQLYIERACKNLKDFLFDGCIENEKEYKALIKHYESILDMHIQNGNNKIKTSFGFKDFLAICFSLPNAYRRFIRVFPKNIIEKTISFLFKEDASIFYRVVDEINKIIVYIKENKTINYTFKTANIFSSAEISTISSLENIHISEDLKNEIYASIFEHYESFGYVKRKEFLYSLLNIINVKSKKGFNLSIKDDNIVVIKQGENEEKEKTAHMQKSLSEELYNIISNTRRGDSHDIRTLLTFLEYNNDRLKDSIMYCNTENIITLLRDVNFEDIDISPLIHFTSEEIIDSYSLLRNVFKGKEEYVNKHTLEFICNHCYSKDHNEDDIKKSYFLSVVNSLVKAKDQLKMIEKKCGEYEESRLLASVVNEKMMEINVNNKNNEKFISETTNTSQQKEEKERVSLKDDNNNNTVLEDTNNNISIKNEKDDKNINTNLDDTNYNSSIKTQEKDDNNSNTVPDNTNDSISIKTPEKDDNNSNTVPDNTNDSSSIKNEKDDNNSNTLLEDNSSIKNEKDDNNSNTILDDTNESSSIENEKEMDKNSLDLCTNIVSMFLEQQGVSLHKTSIIPIKDDEIYFSPLSSCVITILLQFKNGLSLVSSFYDFLDKKEYVHDYDHNILDKLKDEIRHFTTGIHDVKEKTLEEQIPTSIDTGTSFLGLNITVLQLSFNVYNKFMFLLAKGQQESKRSFANIYNFLNNINNKKVIDPVILMKDIKEKENINTLDECLTDVFRYEIFNTSQTLIVGKLKIKNKNKAYLKKFKSLLNNTAKNIPIETKETHEKISGDDHLNNNLKLNIGIDDITSFLQDNHSCKLSKILNLALENNDVHIVDQIMSFVSNLNIEKQCSFFNTLFNTEYNKIVDMVVMGGRATITTTFIYDFIKKRKNRNENEHVKLLLPILLHLLNNKNTTEDKKLRYKIEKEDSNDNTSKDTSINAKLDEKSYSGYVRDIKTILHNDYKYNNSLLTNFIEQECKHYEHVVNVNIDTSKDILEAIYLHKIININDSGENTYNPNKGDIDDIEQKLFNTDVKDKTNEKTKIDDHNKDVKEDEYNSELVKEIYVRNGGLIFLYPFFVKYLSELSLWDNEKHKFVDEYSKNNAIHSLQYIINSKTDNVEWRVILNKLLCGGEYNENIFSGYMFDDDKEKRKQQLNKIKKLSVEIIRTCIKQWGELQKLKRIKGFARGVTIKSFKEYFLTRAAIIKVYRMTNGKDSFFSYLIELSTKIYDEDIATIPWIIDKIQLPWMEKPIYVTNLIIKYKKKKMRFISFY